MSNSPSGDQASDLSAQLLHHLVDFARVFKKTATTDPEVQALMKKNNDLINKLLVTKPKTVLSVASNAPTDWKTVLVQKLYDGKVDLTDATAKKHTSKQVVETAKKIDDLISSLVRHASSFGRFEDKVTFEFDPKSTAPIPSQTIYLRGLTFTMTAYTGTVDVYGVCSEIPAGKSCKVFVEVTTKNHAGRRDGVRYISKVLAPEVYVGTLTNQFQFLDVIQAAVYQDESLGFLKDGKLVIEVVVRADELTDYKPPTNGYSRCRAYDPYLGY